MRRAVVLGLLVAAAGGCGDGKKGGFTPFGQPKEEEPKAAKRPEPV
jgi:hypothetical protein